MTPSTKVLSPPLYGLTNDSIKETVPPLAGVPMPGMNRTVREVRRDSVAFLINQKGTVCDLGNGRFAV